MESDLGAKVKKLRISHGLTQEDVAKALDVTPGYISNVENGRNLMTLRMLSYYAELTGVSLDYLADSGQVLLDGNDMKDIDLRTYRKYLAVVPQTSILFSGTLRDNITYGVDNVDEKALNEAVKAANLTDLVESLPDGLDTEVGEHGGKLSGGQRQRVSIARALIRNPRVIVLDEATSALDSISEKLIQEALNNLTKDRTTFIVAHRLSTIKDADKIAVISEGHCVEYGTFDELMELKGEFYRMKKIQS